MRDRLSEERRSLSRWWEQLPDGAIRWLVEEDEYMDVLPKILRAVLSVERLPEVGE